MRIHYDYDDLFLPEDERPYWCHVEAHDDEGNSVDFYVNHGLEGMFVRDAGGYHQLLGTMQFSLAGKSRRSIQRIIRKMLAESSDNGTFL